MKYSYFTVVFFILLLLLSFRVLESEDTFVYKNIPEKYKNNKGNFGKAILISKKTRDASYPIVRSFPVGYDTGGKTDYTDIIQKVLNTHNNVTFPEFPLLINSKGLSLKNNSQVIFKKGSKLLLETNSKQNYEILRLHEVSNVTVYSPTIIGDREGHMGTTGEWGFGISIRGSQKIKILNAVVKNCWGDGIYLGTTGALTNSDIVIKNSFLDNNRRNGISIISGINITISNSLISNTNGTAPMSGIDLEPNSNKEFLRNIALKNIITFNNKNEGILIALRALYGKENKNATIAIENHLDDNSGFAMGFAFPKKNPDFKNIEGNVTVINSIWKDNTANLVRFHDNNDNVTVKIVRPKVINKDSNFSQKKMEELKTKCKTGEKFLLIE
ncbi:MAG TPA: right-handed parallel beta-helix repeat-containing protein [Flavobacterium sp.]|uniref:right-handed parallel beta-helix repeat-containing protein n=1 Tax=Flavobacterium sp. TaxID=239 RepID=UPI002DB5F51D|nr:right-handed parallel beta-helix repeat-containing protein [Flavobacterium sp.]HEU4789730.1 right-handed parallel beta-helix repeat-containing protein [Flavobacterium sp.]